MAKRTKEPVKTEWERMPEADTLVEGLIAAHHRHLLHAQVVCLGKPKAGRSRGRVVLANAKRPTAAMQALVRNSLGSVHYLIEIGLDAWADLTSDCRRILLDHELCHFAGQDLDTGRWGLVGHDVEEFTQIVRRHGLWRPDLQTFGAAVQQLALPFADTAAATVDVQLGPLEFTTTGGRDA